MPRRTTHLIPTDEEILAQDNVPVEMAARYIGWSSPTIYYALQEQRAPFGCAVKSPKGGWAYNISPGLLVKYKRGDLPTYRLNEVIDLAAEGVERIVNEKLAGVQRLLAALGGSEMTGGECVEGEKRRKLVSHEVHTPPSGQKAAGPA